MIIDFTEFGNDLKSYIDRKFEAESKKKVPVTDYKFPEKVFKMKDMENYLKIARKGIVAAINNGELKAFQIDRDWRSTKEELDKYIDILFKKEDLKKSKQTKHR